jgi:hypothetical protein
MASPLATSALSRRFLIGPLIALSLVGANPTRAPTSALPNTTPSASSTTPAAVPSPSETVRLLLLAHDAEGVYYVDNLVYAAGVGSELRTLKGIEPHIVWGAQVIVQEPAKVGADLQVTILRAPLPGSGSLCMSEVSEVQDAGTYYARVAGTKHCPSRTPGMKGWSQDQSAWGA